MPKPEKVQQVQELREALEQAGNFFLVEFVGLTVSQMTALRGAVIEAGGRLRVVKNTLLRLALRDLGLDGVLDEVLYGPTAILLCGDDPVGPAKVVVDFAEQNGVELRLKAGYVENRSLTAEEAEAVARLPSKLELQAQVVGLLAGPMQELVGILNAAPAELTYLLQAKVDEEGEGQ